MHFIKTIILAGQQRVNKQQEARRLPSYHSSVEDFVSHPFRNARLRIPYTWSKKLHFWYFSLGLQSTSEVTQPGLLRRSVSPAAGAGLIYTNPPSPATQTRRLTRRQVPRAQRNLVPDCLRPNGSPARRHSPGPGLREGLGTAF